MYQRAPRPTRLPERRRNIVGSAFTNARLRRMLVDWEGQARRSLAQFRRSFGRYAGDPSFSELIDDLRRASPEFAAWWPRHEVLGPREARKELDHPLAGRLVLEHLTFTVGATPDQRLMLYPPWRTAIPPPSCGSSSALDGSFPGGATALLRRRSDVVIATGSPPAFGS